MSLKSQAYDHPSYQVRFSFNPADTRQTSDAATVSKYYDKFIAWNQCILYSLNTRCLVAGTSSYTAWNGTATVTTTGTGDSITLYRVFGVGTFGTQTNNAGTATYGPYAIDSPAGGVRKIRIGGTATGTASYAGSAADADGGITLWPGDYVFAIKGTDATSQQWIAYEWGWQPSGPYITSGTASNASPFAAGFQN